MRIMSARMSLSENTAAKRRLGLSCAQVGTAWDAASAAPAWSSVRRSILKSMFPPCDENVIARLANELGRQPTENDVGYAPASPGYISLRAHRPLEDCAEGELVRDIEYPERSDRHVDVDRIDVAAKRAVGLAPRNDAAEQVDDGAVDRAQRRRPLHVPPPRLVFRDHEVHEVLVFDVVVVGELDDSADRFFRRQMVELEMALGFADLRVDALEHREV